MAHIINHPCEGKDCRQCETCKFDEPIPEESHTKKHSLCNYCGYLIKAYKDHGSIKYNACCGKHLIQTEGVSRPRTISFRIEDPADIPVPDWCPKIENSSAQASQQTFAEYLASVETLPTPTEQKAVYNQYHERRKKMESLPRHVDWEDIKKGKVYVIPTIMKQKGKVVKVDSKTEYTVRCIILDEDYNETPYIHNIYRQDLDAVFIVEYHKY